MHSGCSQTIIRKHLFLFVSNTVALSSLGLKLTPSLDELSVAAGFCFANTFLLRVLFLSLYSSATAGTLFPLITSSTASLIEDDFGHAEVDIIMSMSTSM